MFKKIIIGILAFTVVGGGAAAAAYSYAQNQAIPAVQEEPSFAEQILTGNANQGNTNGNGNDNGGQGAGQQSAGQQNAGQQNAGGVQEPDPMAEGLLGDPFEAAGTITLVDLNGVELATDTGESIYVELGPQDFLQSRGIELAVGDAKVSGAACVRG